MTSAITRKAASPKVEWRIATVGDLNPFVTSGSRGWAEHYSDRGSPFVRITNMSRESIYLDLTDLQHVALPPGDREGSRTQLADGDLLVSITADIGIAGYVDRRLAKPAYINQHIALVRFDEKSVDSKFIAYFLAAEESQRAFRAGTDQGAKAGMNLAAVRAIQIALPPLPEQRAIAAALSDVDALIAALDQLIAKKRDLKTAAMQALLTGRRRLPGFTAAFVVSELRALCSMRAGTAIVQAEIDPAAPFRCYGGNGLRGHTTRYTHDGSYVLVGRQGALCGNVQHVEGKFYASEHAIVVAARPGIHVRWLAYALDWMNLNRFTESSAQPGLSVQKLLLLDVTAPPSSEEQAAIAAALADLDAELVALEARREKTKLLKQGMMQELLTGRTRLLAVAS